MKHCLPLLLLLCLHACCAAQLPPVEVGQHPFVRYKSNHLHYDTAAAPMARFFDKWQRVAETGQGDINIVHIGGSHVQAGTLTNTIRVNLLRAHPGLVGGRGMIFPYSAAARCNNPSDYRVRCPQKMILTRNVYKEHSYPLGLCGIAVTASDSAASIKITLTDTAIDYATRRIVVIGHSDQGVVPRLQLGDRQVSPSYTDPRTDRFVFNLKSQVDSFTVVLPCRQGEQFTLTGISLDNRSQGFSYHSIGVNGAAVSDYLRCRNFCRDLRLLHPDLVVFGIGINDAVPVNFDSAAFRRNYMALVDSVRSVNPDCAFIFITNNDSYRETGRRRYAVNTNGTLVREVCYRLAAETGGAVWDQFEVMGGLRSMDRWRQAKLAQNDRVHFTHAGYRLVGNLFTNALFEAYNRHVASVRQRQSDDNERYQYISY